MTTTIYPTSDTIKLRASFRDYAVPPALGSLIDPDTLEVNTYDANEVLLVHVPDGSGDIVRESVGKFTYEWVLPTADGTYYIEFHGTVASKPIIRRKKVKIKWKPVD